ncbi:MAG: hypothetical protein JNJ59_06840 [Deltaproteobacteria bacterium]|nr:hypothetical protein [Deltaproteobacteria bacterium]
MKTWGAIAMGVAVTVGACDPLAEGDWRGAPQMIVRLEVGALPIPRPDELRTLAIVWTSLGGPTDRQSFELPQAEPQSFGGVELRLHASTAMRNVAQVGAAAPKAGVAIGFPLVRLGDVSEPLDLDDGVIAVSDDHYLVWAEDADRARAAGGPAMAAILNPIALEDGFNLAVGVCREGRPSQVLIVPPERVALVPVETVRAGSCLDVFWGAWR